jgi:uncharacterized protein
VTEKDILDLIEKDRWMMEVLRTAEMLNLPDWWIGAGFLRSKVWDYLHGYRERTPLPDIDLIYFDKKSLGQMKKDEKSLEEKLNSNKNLGVNWQVKNQARMHLHHKREPYNNSEEALSEWVETATCIGVRLEKGKLKLTAPHGIEDLVNLIIRPIPGYREKYHWYPNIFENRMKEKKWIEKWPKLKVVK